MKRSILLSLGCFLFSCDNSFASDFHQPTLVGKVIPTFPKANSFRDSSGIVDVIYMIDELGEVFEPAVVASTHPMLNKNAVKAIMKMRYVPYPEEHKGLAFRARKSIYFQNSKTMYAHQPPMTKYQERAKRLLDEDSPNQKRIRRELDRALTTHKIEMSTTGGVIGIGLAVQQLLEFEYAQKFGSRGEQIKLLERAAALHDWAINEGALDDTQKGIFTTVFTSLFVLYVKEKRFADSLYAYEKLKSFAADTAQLASTASQIIALKGDARAIQTTIKTNDEGVALFNPLKENLLIADVPSGLESLKFRCENHYEKIDALDKEYAIELSKKWGQCMIEFIGEQGVMFELIER